MKADDDLVVSNRDWSDVKSDQDGVSDAGKKYLDSLPQPPEKGSPKDNAAWWKGLTPEQRAAWLSLRPDSVGKLDGLPSTVRDEANRVVLDETQARYRIELDGMPKPPANEWTYITAYGGFGAMPSKVHTDEWMDWYRKYGERYDHLTKSLNGMEPSRAASTRPAWAPRTTARACPRPSSSASARTATAGRSSPTATRTRPGTRPSTCRARPPT